jgi:hypothetical protein
MWLVIVLSFGFYMPVVLFAGWYHWVGALMIPKTCAYLWIRVYGTRGCTAKLRQREVPI